MLQRVNISFFYCAWLSVCADIPLSFFSILCFPLRYLLRLNLFLYSLRMLFFYLFFFFFFFPVDGAEDVGTEESANVYNSWLEIAARNVPLPLATRDYVRRNPLREAILFATR